MATREIIRFGPPGHFYECPRWHAGQWWASDMRGQMVYRYSNDGEATAVLKLDDRPGGLGWLPDGTMVVVSIEKMKLLFLDAGFAVASELDLSHLAGETKGFLNDMWVLPSGDIYVGFGQDLHTYGLASELGAIIHVDIDRNARVVATGLAFPNGIVVTPDGKTLVTAETGNPRVSGFAINSDGSLGERQDWGLVDPQKDSRPEGSPPLGEKLVMLDGCGMDADGCLWAADVSSACLRIAGGGEIVDAIFLPDGLLAYACMLGGEDGRTLMICGADDNYQDRMIRKAAQLFLVRVAVPAA